MALAGKIGQPVERTLDVGLAEARALEIARQGFALGHFRRLVQHVAVEDINKDVEHGAIHQRQFTYP